MVTSEPQVAFTASPGSGSASSRPGRALPEGTPAALAGFACFSLGPSRSIMSREVRGTAKGKSSMAAEVFAGRLSRGRADEASIRTSGGMRSRELEELAEPLGFDSRSPGRQQQPGGQQKKLRGGNSCIHGVTRSHALRAQFKAVKVLLACSADHVAVLRAQGGSSAEPGSREASSDGSD